MNGIFIVWVESNSRQLGLGETGKGGELNAIVPASVRPGAVWKAIHGFGVTSVRVRTEALRYLSHTEELTIEADRPRLDRKFSNIRTHRSSDKTFISCKSKQHKILSYLEHSNQFPNTLQPFEHCIVLIRATSHAGTHFTVCCFILTSDVEGYSAIAI